MEYQPLDHSKHPIRPETLPPLHQGNRVSAPHTAAVIPNGSCRRDTVQSHIVRDLMMLRLSPGYHKIPHSQNLTAM